MESTNKKDWLYYAYVPVKPATLKKNNTNIGTA